MQHFQSVARDRTTGLPLASALVEVWLTIATPATLATLYSDNLLSPTPKANGFLANAYGEFDFYAANGRYDIIIDGSTSVYTLGDQLLLDPYAVPLACGGSRVQGNNLAIWQPIPDYIIQPIDWRLVKAMSVTLDAWCAGSGAQSLYLRVSGILSGVPESSTATVTALTPTAVTIPITPPTVPGIEYYRVDWSVAVGGGDDAFVMGNPGFVAA